MKIHLLVIDPQFDFCNPKGNLFVQGADKDMERLCNLIAQTGNKINNIHITLDSHHTVDVAHPVFWKDENGKNPAPFTIITKDDVENGKWRATLPSLQKRASDYVKALSDNGRYPLCIWPPHCLIGSTGATVDENLFNSLVAWENNNFKVVDYVTKGSNIFTEHYSAVQADVPDPSDPTTQLNTRLIQTLESADLVLIAGEASSHCLANTVRDIANNFNDDSIKKMVLIKDATSPVTGFETLETEFIKDMTSKGMSITTVDEFIKNYA